MLILLRFLRTKGLYGVVLLPLIFNLFLAIAMHRNDCLRKSGCFSKSGGVAWIAVQCWYRWLDCSRGMSWPQDAHVFSLFSYLRFLRSGFCLTAQLSLTGGHGIKPLPQLKIPLWKFGFHLVETPRFRKGVAHLVELNALNKMSHSFSKMVYLPYVKFKIWNSKF